MTERKGARPGLQVGGESARGAAQDVPSLTPEQQRTVSLYKDRLKEAPVAVRDAFTDMIVGRDLFVAIGESEKAGNDRHISYRILQKRIMGGSGGSYESQNPNTPQNKASTLLETYMEDMRRSGPQNANPERTEHGLYEIIADINGISPRQA